MIKRRIITISGKEFTVNREEDSYLLSLV